MRKVLTVFCLLSLWCLTMGLSACAGGPMMADKQALMPMAPPAEAAPADFPKSSSSSIHRKTKLEVAQAPAAPDPRKVVYTGSYTVDVYDLQAAAKEWVAWAEKVGGYMEQTAGSRVTVRIPAEHFSEAKEVLARIGRIDDRLTSVKAEDVTARYVDMELRLKTKRDYLVQLRTLQAAAGELKDKLAVQQEIARVVEEIEAMEGQLRLLSKKISLSTIEVTFRLATAGPKRQFRLPWEWLDMIGLERLMG